MRHAAVAYFEGDGRALRPDLVPLTSEGEQQARAAGEALAGVRFDRVVTSGLPRTLETAALVAPSVQPESWPDLRELEAGRLSEIPEDELEEAFLGVFRDVVPSETRFLGGETIASLLERVGRALDTLLADKRWDVVLAVLHGGVNRAILSRALAGEGAFLGNLEQSPACINMLDVGSDGWVVRGVNITPHDPVHLGPRTRTMEELLEQYRPRGRNR